MSSTTKRWATLLTAGVLSLGLVACNGDDGGTATAPTSTASDAAQPTGTEGGDASAAPTEDAGAGTDVAEGEEVAPEDFVAMLKSPGEEAMSTYRMTMDLKAGAESVTMEGAVDLSGDSPRMSMDMEIPGAGAMTMVLADGRMYMSMPGVTEEGKFVEVPEEALGEAATALEDIDFATQYDTWAAGAQKVVFVGEEDVDGTMMRRYEIHLDADAVADAAGVTGSPEDDAALTSALGGETVVYDVWLDEDNFMRRMVMEVEGVVTEMKADGWGEPVDIEVPAEEDLMSGPTG